jgi:hypothetical protein
MAEEDFDQAIGHFAFVESVEEEVRDREMLAISNFWIGRCLRSQGRYDDALSLHGEGARTGAGAGLWPDGRRHASAGKLAGFPERKTAGGGAHAAGGRGRSQPDGRLRQPRQHPVRLRQNRAPRGALRARARVLREGHGRVCQAQSAASQPGAVAGEHGFRRAADAPAIAQENGRRRGQPQSFRRTGRRPPPIQPKPWPRPASNSPGCARRRSSNCRRPAPSTRARAITAAWARSTSCAAFLCLDSGELDSAGSEAAEAFRLGEKRPITS